MISKRAIFELVLQQSPGAFLLIPFPHADLLIPQHLTPSPEWPLILEYGLNMARPIPDLQITDDGVKATLAFGADFFTTFVPWAAVAVVLDKEKTFAANWPVEAPAVVLPQDM